MDEKHDDERTTKPDSRAGVRHRERGAPGETRKDRLARALRDNLKKRKAQQRARSRRGGEGSEGERG